MAIDDSDADDASEDDSELGKEDIVPVAPADRPMRNRGQKKTYVIDDSEAGSDEGDDSDDFESEDDYSDLED